MKQLMEHFTCPICLDVMIAPKIPKVLHCSHTICSDCAISIRSESSIKCPLCNSVTPTTDPPNNVTMMQVIDSMKIKQAVICEENKLVCQNCDVNMPSHHCLECCQYLCQQCLIAHDIMKVSRRHRRLPIDKMSSIVVPKKPIDNICEKHSENVKNLFCETCRVFVCRDCLLFDHDKTKHQVLFIDDALLKHGQEADSSLAQGRSILDTAAKELDNLKSSRDVRH